QYSNPLQKAKHIINPLPTTTLHKPTIQHPLLQFQNPTQTLHPHQKLQHPKNQPLAQIHNLQPLNPPHLLPQKTLLNQPSTKPQLQQPLQKPKQLNQAIEPLKTQINKK
ncbi:hypothetical protein, partial [Staphylococcus epidermidis]|uniref:hypothetical protein n=1 Tax=Staphylococcus epidermidis TaxID=1282 RepID=UPI001C930FB6